MQGNNTDAVLTDSRTRKFNKELTDNLILSKSFSEGFCESFDNLTEKTQKFDIGNLFYNFPKLFVILFLGVHCYFMVFHNPYKEYSNYEYIPNYHPKQNFKGQNNNQTTKNYSFGDFQQNIQYIDCPYCGNRFPKNEKCPSCSFKYF